MDYALNILNYIAGVNVASWVLLGLMLFALWIAVKAQRRADFDFAQMLVDVDGKPSAMRLGVLMCLPVSTWTLVYAFISSKEGVSDNMVTLFIIYVTTWSGAKVLEKGIEAWSSVKGGSTSTTSAVTTTSVTTKETDGEAK